MWPPKELSLPYSLWPSSMYLSMPLSSLRRDLWIGRDSEVTLPQRPAQDPRLKDPACPQPSHLSLPGPSHRLPPALGCRAWCERPSVGWVPWVLCPRAWVAGGGWPVGVPGGPECPPQSLGVLEGILDGIEVNGTEAKQGGVWVRPRGEQVGHGFGD